jgi:hypothetical protein
MKTYTEVAHECAVASDLRSPNERREQLDAYVAKRAACEGRRNCIYSALQEHVSVLGQRVPSVADCVALKQEKK